MKLFLLPTFDEPDTADGGIRRVVEAQVKHLPKLGIDLVSDIRDADICAYHAMDWKDTSKPVVSHCHGMYWREYEWGKWAGYINERVMTSVKSADIVTSPTEWVARIIRYEMWVDPMVIPHGIDLVDWPYEPNPYGYVLWNKARMDIMSNPTPLHALAERLMDTKFVTTFAVRPLPNIEIVGKLPFDEAKSLVTKCGTYLSTTRETFGIGTLEAMACGKPILGWDWAGNSEIVTHLKDGYLCKVGDYDELVEGYHYIQEHYMRMSQAARQTVVDRFTWDRVMPAYVKCYERALDMSRD